MPDEALLKEVDGTSTWESLRAVGPVPRRAATSTEVVLVTDGYHAFRVEAIAEDIGLDATVSPDRLRGSRAPASSASSLRETAAVVARAASSATTACSGSTTPSTTERADPGVRPAGAVR